MYASTRQAIFEGAAACVSSGKTTLVVYKLMREDEAEAAFAEWQALGSSLVTMRLTTTADGSPAAEFTPPT